MQISLIQKMKWQANQTVFRNAIKNWFKIFKEHGYEKVDFKKLHEDVCNASNAQILFDSRFGDAILYCINISLCQAFGDAQTNGKDLEIYEKMTLKLQKTHLIGKRQVFAIKSIKPQTLINRIDEFRAKAMQSVWLPEEIQKQWFELIGLDLVEFWRVAINCHINHEILLPLYEITSKSPSVIKLKQVEAYMSSFRKEEQPQFQQSQIFQDFRFLKQQQYLKQTKQNSLSESYCIFDQSLVVQGPILQEIHENSFFSDKDNEINHRLNEVAFYYSMFKNPIYSQNLTNLQRFINAIHQFLIARNYKLHTFGSLRSSFALANEYDIDLTYLSQNPNQNSRTVAITHLFQIQGIMKCYNMNWIKKSKVYCFQNLPMPYLKMDLAQVQFREGFKIINATKLDITIGNKPAVINSDLLAQFAKVQEIHFFCILVKFWAKSRNVINIAHPMHGLSSYVVVIMCIYYLMETKQIDFIELSKKDLQSLDIGKVLHTVKRVQMVDIYENFKGFLQFFSQTGRFQKERKAIYLLKQNLPQDFVFNQNFVINVCDFVDGTNPGRLVMDYKDNLFEEVKRASFLLKSKNIEKINQIFEKYTSK